MGFKNMAEVSELRDWDELVTDEDGMGTVEIILIIVVAGIGYRSRILCGNKRFESGIKYSYVGIGE